MKLVNPRPAIETLKGPLSGICKGGPRDGMMHATLSGRRTPMDGGAYVYTPAPDGHHVGLWLWLEDKK